MASAAPSGGSVVSGSATITQNGNTTTIQQLTSQVIINWNSFGLNANELAQFLQPSSLAVALNRVTGIDPSVILGSLKANGRIFLINPNGILFGPGSAVNVGGLVASTLDISNQDFLSGNYTLTQNPSLTPSFVLNEGNITAVNGGFVVLVAPLVDNEGTIIANLGEVGLGGGTNAVLNFDGAGFVNFVLGSAGSNNNVVLTPQAFTNTIAEVMNDKNIVSAGSVSQSNGQVVLVGASGTVINAGTIAANGSSNASAGSVALNSLQATVLAPNSTIEANGTGSDSNGGNITVDSQGSTWFNSGASINAIGGTSGNGGDVELSDKTGGSVAGLVNLTAANGKTGTFLIDPYNTLIDSCGNDSCENDTTGPILFFDTYVATSVLTGASSNVTIQSSNAIGVDSGLGTVTVGGGNSLTLEVTPGFQGASIYGILFEGTGTTLATAGSGSITLCAGVSSCDGGVAAKTGTGYIMLGAGSLTTQSGNIELYANNGITANGASLKSLGANVSCYYCRGGNGGDITLNASDYISLSSGIVESLGGSSTYRGAGGNGGTVSLNASSGDITITNHSTVESSGGIGGTGSAGLRGNGGAISLDAPSGDITITYNSTVESSGGNNLNQDWNGGIGGDITLSAGGSLTISSSTVESAGGNGGTDEAGDTTGGSGGDITLSAGGSLTLTNSIVESLGGSGSSTYSGKGGNGGAVSLSTSSGDIAITYNSTVESSGGNGGFDGGKAGNGGAVSLNTSSGDIAITNYSTLESSGGNGGTDETGDNTGGNGGAVSLSTSSGDITITYDSTLSSSGGDSGISGGKGGSGGAVSLNTSSGDITITNFSTLESAGGYGGALYAGGNGGNVSLTASSGDITITNFSTLESSGGIGGSNGTAGTVILTAGGSATLDDVNGTGVTGLTDVNSPKLYLTATGSRSSIHVNDQDAATVVKVTTKDGNVNVTFDPSHSQSLTFTSGVLSATDNTDNADLSFDNTSGSIALDAVNAGTGIVDLDASGNITDNSAGVDTNVTGSGITLTGHTGIGESGDAIDISVGSGGLTASATNSDIYITTAGNLPLNTVSSGTGSVSLASTDGNISFNAGGSIATTGSGNIALCAGVSSCDGGVTAGSGEGNITVNGSLTTDLPAASGNPATGGNITLDAAGDVVVDAPVTADAGDNSAHVTADLSDAGNINIDAGTYVQINSGAYLLAEAAHDTAADATGFNNIANINITANGANSGVGIALNSAYIETYLVYSTGNFENAGNIDLNATAGNIAVTGASSETGGYSGYGNPNIYADVTDLNSSGGAFPFGSLSIDNTGNITLSASGSIAFDTVGIGIEADEWYWNEDSSAANISVTDSADVSVTAGTTLTFDAAAAGVIVDANSMNYDAQATGAGDGVTIGGADGVANIALTSTTGDMTFESITDYGVYDASYYLSYEASGQGGSSITDAGNITLTSTAGNISFTSLGDYGIVSGSSNLNEEAGGQGGTNVTDAGNVALNAGGGITFNGGASATAIYQYAAEETEEYAGENMSDNGDVLADNVGNVTLNAAGDILFENIEYGIYAYNVYTGYDADYSANNQAAAPSNVTLEDMDNISLTSTGGGITFEALSQEGIVNDAYGINEGAGYDANNNVTSQAGGNVETDNVANVTLNAADDILFENLSNDAIYNSLYGANYEANLDANEGATSGGSVTATDVGNVSLTSTGGSITFGGTSSGEGIGGSAIYNDPDSANEYANENGAGGAVDTSSTGNVTLSAAGAILFENITDSGIDNESDYFNLNANYQAQNGGAVTVDNSGNISVTSTGGSITFETIANLGIDNDGGAQNIFANYSASGGSAGVTNSGNTTLSAADGSITFNNATIDADEQEVNSGDSGTLTVSDTADLEMTAGAGIAFSSGASVTLDIDQASGTLTSVGNVTIDAGSGALSDDSTTYIDVDADTAGTGNITLSGLSIAASGATLQVSDSPISPTLAATATGSGGGIYITDDGALSGLSVTTNNGNVTVDFDSTNSQSLTFASGVLSAAASSDDTNISFDNTGGSIALDAVNAGTGTVSLDTTGSITDNSAGADTNVTGNTITLTSDTGIGASGDAVKISAGEGGLTASATDSGIYITSTGDLPLNTVNAGTGNVSLTTTGGNITDNTGGVDTNVTGNDITLNADTGIGSSGDYLATASSGGSLSATTTGSGDSIYIDEADALTNLTVSVNDGNAAVDFDPTNSQSLTFASGTLNATASYDDTNLAFTNTGGNITVNTVASGNGNVSISSDPGDIDFASDGSITTTGNGNVTLCAGATICGGDATSGNGNIALGNGAISTQSGNISLYANNDITGDGASIESIGVSPNGPTFNGFSGGAIILNAGEGISLTSSTVESEGGNGAYDGGSAGSGGSGGAISFTAGGGITLTDSTMKSDGGSGGRSDAFGAGGGSGGDITLIAGGEISLTNSTVESSGGNGGNGSNADGGSGGIGGTILFTSDTGITLTGDTVENSGGSGGNGNNLSGNGGNGANAENVSLTAASGDISVTDSTVASSGGIGGTGSVNGTSGTDGTVILTAGGSATLDDVNGTGVTGLTYVNAPRLYLTATGSGSAIDVPDQDAVTLLNVTTNNGDVNVTFDPSNSQSLTFASGLLNVADSVDNAVITFDNTGGDITVDVVNAGTGNVSLTSSGDIEGDGASSLLTGASATLTAGTDIGGSNALNTVVGTLNATTSDGDIDISNNGNLALTASAAGGNITIGDTGALALNTVTAAGNNVSLTASGDIEGGTITADSATLNAGGNIGKEAAITTNLSSLNATAAVGDIVMNNTGNLSLTASAASGDITIGETGNLTLNTVSAEGNAVTLTSSGDIEGGTIDADSATLTAGTDIGGTTAVNTNVSTLTAAASNGGIDISNNGDLSLTATATNGNITIGETGNLSLNSVSAEGNAVTLTASGDIEGGTITADSATLTAGTDIGGTAAIGTTLSTLTATAANGSIDVNNAGNLTLTASATNGNVDITDAGSLTVSSVSASGSGAAGGNIQLSATGGITLTGISSTSGGVTITSSGNGILPLVESEALFTSIVPGAFDDVLQTINPESPHRSALWNLLILDNGSTK